MKEKAFLIGILFLLLIPITSAQQSNYSVSINLSVEKKFTESFKKKGRLFIFFSLDSIREPRTQTGPNSMSKTHIFAKNISDFDPEKPLIINGETGWIGTPEWTLNDVPAGDYYVQLLWDQNSEESRINEPGNIYTEKGKIIVDHSQKLSFSLSQKIESRKIDSHSLVRMVELKSDTLSKWWGNNMMLKATILLPHNYDSEKEYPIRYNVAGYGGRYDRINWILRDQEFMTWWVSGEAPEIINVFLDGEGPFGDSYQMDSENSGPYGHALVQELIPHIESLYRGTQSSSYRFVDGCSTGGWVSLALQLFYPDQFNGCWSYSPDPVNFRHMQLVNIYEDENAFYNDANYLIPSMRDVYGNPKFSIKQEVTGENVQGYSNTYTTSGNQWGSWNALFSPKGDDDLPKPLFDPITGIIDSTTAAYWKRYDLLEFTQENWPGLGPKIQDKIYIWMGDMDNYYLNNSLRAFDKYLSNTLAPKSNAEVVFSPMKGHCSEFSHRTVLEKIHKRILEIEETNGNK